MFVIGYVLMLSCHNKDISDNVNFLLKMAKGNT